MGNFHFKTVLALSAFLFVQPANSGEKLRIDIRTQKEPRLHAVTLAASSGELGHAFVIWSKEDDQRRMSTQEATGFYPNADKHHARALFGMERGRMFDDSRSKREVEAIVLVDSTAYEQARAVFQAWKKEGRYTLLLSDCTTYVGQIASAIGLKTPARILYPEPLEFVRGVMKFEYERRAAAEERKAAEAREKAAQARRRVERAKKLREIAELNMALAILNRQIRAAEALSTDIERYEGAIGRQSRAAERYDREAIKHEQEAVKLKLKAPP